MCICICISGVSMYSHRCWSLIFLNSNFSYLCSGNISTLSDNGNHLLQCWTPFNSSKWLLNARGTLPDRFWSNIHRVAWETSLGMTGFLVFHLKSSPLLSLVVRCCPLLPIVVNCCPLLSIVVHWYQLLSIIFHCYPLLSIAIYCCKLLSYFV